MTSPSDSAKLCRFCFELIKLEPGDKPWRVKDGDLDEHGGQHYIYPLHQECAEKVRDLLQ